MSTFLDFFRKYLSPPVFQDEEQTRRARIVFILHISLIFGALMGILGELIRIISMRLPGFETSIILSVGIALTIIPYILNRRGDTQSAGFILLTIMLTVVTALLLIGDGIHDIALSALPVLLFLSALILQRRGVSIFTMLAVSAIGIVVFIEVNPLPWFPPQFIPQVPTITSYVDFFIVASILVIGAIASYILITQLASSFNRVRLSDARIRALVENSPDTILEIDRSGKILFINRFAETYLGKNVREALPADQVDSAVEVIEKAFTSGEPQAVELQTIAPDGRVSWDSIRIGPVKQGNETTSLTIIMTEITAQREAESAIRESEARYRLISSVTSDYTFSTKIDREGNMSLNWVAGAFEAMTGYTMDEYKAQGGWLAHLYPEDIEKDLQALAKLKDNQSITHEIRTFTKARNLQWVQVYAHPVWDENTNRLVGIVGAVQDITERKQLEQSIRKSEHDIRSFIEISEDPIFNSVFDEPIPVDLPAADLVERMMKGARVAECNLAFARLYLYESVAQAKGQIVLFTETDQRLMHELVRNGFSLNDFESEEILDGRTYYFASTINTIIQDGKLITIWGTIRDITARNQAEEKIHQSNLQLLTLNEIDRAISEVTDLDSLLEVIRQQLEKVVEFDFYGVWIFKDPTQPMATHLAIYESGQYWPEPDSELVLGSDAYTVFETGNSILHLLTKDEIEQERQFASTDHIGDLTKTTNCMIYVPLKKQGKTIGTLSVQRYQPTSFTMVHLKLVEAVATQVAIAIENARLFTDLQQELAERIRVEKEREILFRELEDRNAEMERFNYTISHELKSPVVTIKGFLGFLKKDMEENRQDRVQKDFERISEATEKMGGLLSDLLELSRIGRVVNPPTEVDLAKLAHEALEMLDGRIQSRNITVHISPDLPIVHGDHTRLREVFENLIDNAAKYMGKQSDPRIEIGKREDGAETIIYVKDNGMGIEPQFHTRIFGLFEKLNPASEGTGIGLALIKRIIEVQRGRIWVESEGLGKGSTFCFTIPVGQ